MAYCWDKKVTHQESIKTLEALLRMCKGLDSLWIRVAGIKYAIECMKSKQLSLFKGEPINSVNTTPSLSETHLLTQLKGSRRAKENIKEKNKETK